MTPEQAEALLEEKEADHLAARIEARRASDARLRAINDARDAGLSYRQMARAMTAAHPEGSAPVRPGDIPKLLACGYPAEELSPSVV